MNAVKEVSLDTPVGPRQLRWTAGASKRIRDRFGSVEGIDDGDTANIVEAAWYMMFDGDGNPPKELSLERWLDSYPMSQEAVGEIGAAMGAAMSDKSKNEVRQIMDKAIASSTGSDTKPSPESASDSAESNSGGDIPSRKSTRSQKSGERSRTARTTGQVPLQPQL